MIVHIRELRGGRHHSDYLQRAWNKYGERLFQAVILITCQKDRLIDVEQMCINKYDSYKAGYNVRPTADMRTIGESTKKKLSIKAKQRRMSDETKAIWSKQRSGKGNPMYGVPSPNTGKKFSAEHRAKIGKALKGRIFTEEHKQKLKAKKGLSGKTNPNYKHGKYIGRYARLKQIKESA